MRMVWSHLYEVQEQAKTEDSRDDREAWEPEGDRDALWTEEGAS